MRFRTEIRLYFNKLFASKLWRDFNVSLVLFLVITTGVYFEFCLNTDVKEYEGNVMVSMYMCT